MSFFHNMMSHDPIGRNDPLAKAGDRFAYARLQGKTPPPTPGVPNQNDAANAAQAQTDAFRMRRGMLANIYGGASSAQPVSGKIQLGTQLTPAAVLKAESLAAYARSSGSPLSEFAVALTLGEGYELLDYLASGAMGILRNHEMLKRDIADAKAEGDPFIVLSNFQLLGLDIVKVETLN